MFAWFVTWLLLFGPAIEACTYAVLSPAIAWAMVDNWRRPRGWVSRLMLGMSLLLAGPAVTDAFGSTFRRFANEHAVQPIGAIIFLVYLLLELGHHVVGEDTCPKRKRGQHWDQVFPIAHRPPARYQPEAQATATTTF